MLSTIIFLVVLLVAVVLGLAVMKPDIFKVQRSISIKAPPEKIFALINDYHQWGHWSPYENIDPAMKKTFSGPEKGKGAVYEWEGNAKIGKGRMEILESSSHAKIIIKLDFFKPMEAHNTAEFTLEPKGDVTEVTWAMYGPASLMVKVMHMFFNMDKMVGGQFAEGLSKLKALAERA
jgi:carbon monoxide dehydrogenase subunit G